MTHNGFENLRMEGRKQLLKLLEPYLRHTYKCEEDSEENGYCTCGLDEIIERVKE